MGDSRRFDQFAKVIAKNLSRSSNIADVAGGKGYLQAALRQLGYNQITSWDKRRKYASNRRGYRYGWFEWDKAPSYDAVVAMHPDEATDHCILYALSNLVPAIICPCCVKPNATSYWGRHNYRDWCLWLENLIIQRGGSFCWTKLKISGRNDVLIVHP